MRREDKSNRVQEDPAAIVGPQVSVLMGNSLLYVPITVIPLPSKLSCASPLWRSGCRRRQLARHRGKRYAGHGIRWNAHDHGVISGNTFVTGVAIPLPMGGFPNGVSNVTWSAAFSTDEPGISFQWGWSAGIYNSSFGGGTCPSGSAVCPTSTYASASNSNLLGVNQEDGSGDPHGLDSAGTPETYKQDDVIGFFSATGGVVPTAAEMSTAPSSYNFGTLPLTTSSGPTAVAVLSNNDTVSHKISGITISGPSDFTLVTGTNSCTTGSLAAGGSCTLYVNFTANYTGTESAKIAVTDNANNSPQTVYLTGTGH